jgi:diguanylate cyclase (GGDEF)-like protein
MHTTYPDVTDAELRAQYQSNDRVQANRVLRFVMGFSLPLLYIDFLLLGMGQSFVVLAFLRTVAFVSAWWILRGSQRRLASASLEQYLFYWAILVLSVQIISDFLSPLSYLGHFVIDVWICMVISIVLPIRSATLRGLVYAYWFATTALCLTKIFPSFVYQASLFVVLILSTYTGQAVAAYLQKFRLKLLSAEFELQRKEITDPLTGLANRREFLRNMENELQRHKRLGKSMSVLMFDIEDLKQVNMQFGAGTADMVLVEVSKRMQRATRNYDCLARYGTEEFVVLLPEAFAEVATKIAARALNTISAMPVAVSGKEVKISSRVGVATMQDSDNVESMLRRAEDDLKRVQYTLIDESETQSQTLVFA